MQSTGRIKVWNNGQGVPVEMHKKENVYVPELIFGHLLTSSNYEDGQKKVCNSSVGAIAVRPACTHSAHLFLFQQTQTHRRRAPQQYNSAACR